jgi:hypothetical protein
MGWPWYFENFYYAILRIPTLEWDFSLICCLVFVEYGNNYT